MQVRLDNIGLIKDSTIKLDGLTVITGSNNSGKSTVGKVLYSLIEGTRDMSLRYESELRSKLARSVYNFVDKISSYPIYIRDAVFPGIMSGGSIVHMGRLFESTNVDMAQMLINQLEKLDTSDEGLNSIISERKRNNKPQRYYQSIRTLVKETIEDFQKNLRAMQDSKLPDEFAKASINAALRGEFSGQILPIKEPESIGRICLQDNDTHVYYDIAVRGDKIVSGNDSFISAPFKKAILIDDPYIIDNDGSFDFVFSIKGRGIRYGLDVEGHRDYLKKLLTSEEDISIIEEIEIQKAYDAVLDLINNVLPGDVVDDEQKGFCYALQGSKLVVDNMATGSKFFAILKMLLAKGYLDKKTILILDEPEAHLHPQWQNQLAEVLARLVSQLNVTVIVTTHSSNMLLALEAYSYKEKIRDRSSFYETQHKPESDFISYQECGEGDISQMYLSFAKEFSIAKAIREKHRYEDDNDD